MGHLKISAEKVQEYVSEITMLGNGKASSLRVLRVMVRDERTVVVAHR